MTLHLPASEVVVGHRVSHVALPDGAPLWRHRDEWAPWPIEQVDGQWPAVVAAFTLANGEMLLRLSDAPETCFCLRPNTPVVVEEQS